MSLFRPADVYGIAGTMLFLIVTYLILNNALEANTLFNTASSSVVNVGKMLQGR